LASLDDFLSLQIRVGTIVSAQLLTGAPKPVLPELPVPDGARVA
jgi:hypothetical protein